MTRVQFPDGKLLLFAFCTLLFAFCCSCFVVCCFIVCCFASVLFVLALFLSLHFTLRSVLCIDDLVRCSLFRALTPSFVHMQHDEHNDREHDIGPVSWCKVTLRSIQTLDKCVVRLGPGYCCASPDALFVFLYLDLQVTNLTHDH